MQPINYNDAKLQRVNLLDQNANWTGEIEDKPEIEQLLFKKQEQYYKYYKNPEKQQAIWQDMFLIIQRYAKSLVLKKKKGGRYTQPDRVEDEATQTALSFMVQYVNRPGYHVGASFAGMINPKVLETLYGHSKDDNNYSLHNVLGDSNLELEDMQKSMNFEPLYKTHAEPDEFIYKISLPSVLNSIIKEFKKEVSDEKIQLKLMFFIQILLRKPKNKHIIPMFMKYITVDKKEYDLIQLFQLELYNRLTE